MCWPRSLWRWNQKSCLHSGFNSKLCLLCSPDPLNELVLVEFARIDDGRPVSNEIAGKRCPKPVVVCHLSTAIDPLRHGHEIAVDQLHSCTQGLWGDRV